MQQFVRVKLPGGYYAVEANGPMMMITNTGT